MEALTSDAWYVLKTKPRQDERAIQSLDNQGFEVFGPKLTVKKVRRGKRMSSVEPMFPGYVFVRPDNLIEQFYKLRNTFGVNNVLKFGDSIPTIPQSWIDDLRSMDAAAESDAPQVGDSVEIKEGPFRGYMAKIVELDGESRCFVLLEWMQKKVRANFSYSELTL
ncbi:MAG: transcription/translation regulatory transformer protein RfaH [Idiomarina sp.]|uniref:transcription/translation regulatory transformer protein RfaH n=1 Tax=Idiomarina sp. TaxID=1874361 RepID=UPI000C44FB9E|nr:transcription/translation regulatory transformer protein RfaH [Idiomarina sp.]MBT43404.1 transcription/translation regulatory transformer protein RfaH [Idiomarina sp.]